MEEIWRTKGKLALPELLNDFSDEETTPYLALTAAKDLTLSSLRRGNSELASRSFSYAEWCRLQKDEDVRNAAYVCFYEYIFEDDSLETKVAGYIPKSVFENILNFVAFHCEDAPEKSHRIKRLYDLE